MTRRGMVGKLQQRNIQVASVAIVISIVIAIISATFLLPGAMVGVPQFKVKGLPSYQSEIGGFVDESIEMVFEIYGWGAGYTFETAYLWEKVQGEILFETIPSDYVVISEGALIELSATVTPTEPGSTIYRVVAEFSGGTDDGGLPTDPEGREFNTIMVVGTTQYWREFTLLAGYHYPEGTCVLKREDGTVVPLVTMGSIVGREILSIEYTSTNYADRIKSIKWAIIGRTISFSDGGSLVQGTGVWSATYDTLDLVPGSIYDLRVTMTSKDEILKEILFRPIAVTGNEPPTTPIITLITYDETTEEVSISWTASIDPDGSIKHYIIEYGQDPLFTSTPTRVDVEQYLDTTIPNLDRGVIWYFRMKAEDNEGAISYAWSPVESIDIPSGANELPTTPVTSSLTYDQASDTVTFTWNEATDTDGIITKYYVSYWTGSETPVEEDVGLATSFEVSGLVKDRLWLFQVRAEDDDGGMSSWSTSLSVFISSGTTTTTTPPPLDPMLIIIVGVFIIIIVAVAVFVIQYKRTRTQRQGIRRIQN